MFRVRLDRLSSARALIVTALAVPLLTAHASWAQTVTATWDRNTDVYTVGYRLSYGTAPGSYSTNVDVGNQISRQLTLSPGQTYYFVVRAYDSASRLGAASAEASITMAALPPTAQITATLGANNTALVSWQTTNASAVTINGTPMALTGSAQYPITSTTTYTAVATGPGGSISASATVVVPRVDCVVSAWSFQSATAWSACAGGQRSRSETWIRTILTQPSGGGAACGPLQEVRVVSEPCTIPPTAQISATSGTTPGTASVTWSTANATTATINGTAVALSGNAVHTIAATTTFTLMATGPGGTSVASATLSVTPVDCVLSDWSFQSATPWGSCSGGRQIRTETWTRTILTPSSGGGAACGPLEEERIASQPCSDPTPMVPGEPTRFGSKVSGSSVTLKWGEPATGGPPAGYRLSVGTSPGSSDIVRGGDVGNVLSVSGTLARGTYFARIAAYNGAGQGPDAPEIRFKVGANNRPGPPLGFVGSLEDSVAVLSWQAPAGDDANSPTGYVIEAGSAPGLTDLARVAVGPASRYEAVIPPGTYFVRVRAVNDLGAGDPSDEIVLRRHARLHAPTDLTVVGGGPLVMLFWIPPATGDVPASYLIEAGSATGRADLAVLRVGNTTRFTTTAPPGTYYVRVRAVGVDGHAGEASNEVIVRR